MRDPNDDTVYSRTLIIYMVVSVGKVSDGGRDRVAVSHQHKIGLLVSYLEIQWPEHVPRLTGKYHPDYIDLVLKATFETIFIEGFLPVHITLLGDLTVEIPSWQLGC